MQREYFRERDKFFEEREDEKQVQYEFQYQRYLEATRKKGRYQSRRHLIELTIEEHRLEEMRRKQRGEKNMLEFQEQKPVERIVTVRTPGTYGSLLGEIRQSEVNHKYVFYSSGRVLTAENLSLISIKVDEINGD